MTKHRQYLLNFRSLDPEAKFGFHAAPFTGVRNVPSLLIGIALTAVFYGALYPLFLPRKWQMVDMFFPREENGYSTIPIFTVLLAGWCLGFLWLKKKKLKLQRRALDINLAPENWENNYVISPQNAPEILHRLHMQICTCDDFLLLHRVECALSNLKNIGRIADVSTILNDIAEDDANYTESTYTLPKGLIWAIPVIGFIGTVLGLSQAVGGFGKVVAGGADLTKLKDALGGVTGGLATAFETTLIALVAALVIQLLMTLVTQKEEEFLNDCTAYCQRNITARLKMLDTGDEFGE